MSSILSGMFISLNSYAQGVENPNGVSIDREPATVNNPQNELSKEDRRILARGEISKGRYIGGGV